jgi:predicted small metal-binding protein
MPEFECGAPNCDFLVRANDEDEIVAVVRRHAREKHDRNVDADHVRERIED